MIKFPQGTRSTDFILIADLHLHQHPQWRFEWCQNFLDALLNQAKKSKPYLVFLGDVFEVRDKLDARVMNMFIEFCIEYSGETIWITGQHDSYIPGVATIHSLGRIGNVHVVDDDVAEIGGVWCVPFARNPERYRELLNEVPDDEIVFTHMPIKEILETFTKQPEGIIELADFDRFFEVLSGDIHKHKDFVEEANCIFHYVGAPSQRGFNDEGVEGVIGWYRIYEDDTEFKRLPVTHPKFVKVKNRRKLNKILADKKNEYIVRLIGTDDTPLADHEYKHIKDWTWEPAPVEQELSKLDQNTELSEEELITEYLDMVSDFGELDRKMLERTAHKLLEEVK